MTEPTHYRNLPPGRTRDGGPADRPAGASGTGEQVTAGADRPDAAREPARPTGLQAGTEVPDGAASAQPGAQAKPADLLPSVTLPKGGGAIRGLGEKFSVNAATGTASMTVPVPLSPGRSGFTPPLGLSYDSASGNGPFGFGWSLGVPAITRKTDKGLPVYRDDEESDVFILAGLGGPGARARCGR